MSRSSWKPSFVHSDILNSLLQEDSSIKKEEIVVYNRNTLLTEEMLGLRFFVYNGIRFFSIEVTTEKLGHRLGEFSPTKKKPIAKKKKK